MLSLCVSILSGCQPEALPHPDVREPAVQFVDVAEEVGLVFRHFNGFSGEYYYVETFGSGAAFLDADGDGWLDIYLVNGAALASTTTPRPRPVNQLFASRAGRAFTDITEASGTGDPGYGMGCAVADIDGDGDRDLFVTNFGGDVLLRNDGHAHFTDATESLGLGSPGWGTGTGFFDYDGDGDLDLYVVQYVQFSVDANVPCRQGSIRSYCNPDAYEPAPDILYRNDGDRFTDVSARAGVTVLARGLGLALSDFDADGDTDVYVANDGDMNVLYENRGGSLVDVGLELGVRYNEGGLAEAGMGVDFGDMDNDGMQDLFVANFALETHTLYRRDREGPEFSDATERLGLAEPTFKPLGFGARFLDFDNDSDLDLFVANGHVMDVVARVHAGLTYRQTNQMLMNMGGRFVDVSERLGSGLELVMVSRAAAVGDYDNDGDMDILVTNVSSPPTLLRNDGGNRRHWLLIDLVGRAHPDALGARVSVSTGETIQIRERQTAGSYLSSHDPRLHFGLGDAIRADVQIRWADGATQVLRNVAADQILRIVQPAGGRDSG